jgi:hypothetical protein
MATQINAEGVKRTDKGFFIPVNNVIIDFEKNSRFGPPTREQVDVIKDSIRREEQKRGVNGGQHTPAEIELDTEKRPVLVVGYGRAVALKELQEEDGQERLLWAIPVKGNPEEMYVRSIEENIKRTDASAMDNAKNIRKLVEGFKWPIEKVCELYGTKERPKSPAWVTQTLKLLQLDNEQQQLVHRGEMTADIGIFLADKIQPELRKEVWEDALREVAERRGALVEDGPQEPPPPPPADMPLEPPSADAPAPAPAKKKAPAKKTGKKAAPSKADVIKAAEKKGAVNSEKAGARKAAEIKAFWQEVHDEELEGDLRDFAKIQLQFAARKLTDQQMKNRLYTHFPQNKKKK